MPKLNDCVVGLCGLAVICTPLTTKALRVQSQPLSDTTALSESNRFSEMTQGAALRKEAKTLLKYAKKYLLNANQMNKSVLALQALNRQLSRQIKRQGPQKNPQQPPEVIQPAVQQPLDQMQQQLHILSNQQRGFSQQGSELRASGERLLVQGRHLMKQGFVRVWQDRITSLDPIDSEVKSQLVAHNTRLRSVKPNMPQAADPRFNVDEIIPSLLLQRGDQSRPMFLDTDSFQQSMHGHFFVHIVSEYRPRSGDISPNESYGGEALSGINRVPINEMHTWLLLITDADGRKVTDLDIEVEGHMPGHVHGLPTAPQVMPAIEPGVYPVEGMKFQMTGWWVMRFILNQGTLKDRVSFNLDL